jgi:hypothetical protein
MYIQKFVKLTNFILTETWPKIVSEGDYLCECAVAQTENCFILWLN